MVTSYRGVEKDFRALADPSRRHLLDRLFERDGQPLTELETHLPAMTHVGVMKHLRVLEGTDLVVSHKVGREKLHHLNPVPIRRLHDRWLDKFSTRAVASLLDLQRALETATVPSEKEERRMVLSEREPATTETTAPSHVFRFVIRTTPEALWAALTESDFTVRYYPGMAVESDWAAGTAYRMTAGGQTMITGMVVDVDPPRRLVTTFEGHFNADIAAHAPTRVTYEIEPMGPLCKLTVIHDGLTTDTPGTAGPIDGWLLIISGLKRLV